MRGIKPFKLSFVTRPFVWGTSYHLGVAVMGYFPLEAAPTLLTDMEMWMEVPEVLGKDVLIDSGIPKSRSELLVMGDAWQPGGVPAPVRQVRAQVGSLEKSLYVVGDRHWKRGVPTEPEPFVSMPLTWENAYGGEGYAKNPRGKGYAKVEDEEKKLRPLPNVELPGDMIRRERQHPEPAAFGPIDFTWPQRFDRAGTYGDKWLKTRFPGFAEDMDWRIWNMASEDQWQDEPFRGDEPIVLENLHPQKPVLRGQLPGIRARAFIIHRYSDGGHLEEVPLKLTTVWLLPGIERGIVVFHGAQPIHEDDADDVETIMVAAERLDAQPRPRSHYQQVLQRRIGPDGMFAALEEGDLMPDDLTGLGSGIAEQTALTTPELLRMKRQRQAADKTIEEARAKLVAMGLDPDEHGPSPLPPLAPVPSLSEAGDMMHALVAEAAAKKAEAEAMEEAQLEKLKAFCEKMGLDHDQVLSEMNDAPGGPPDFTADGQRARVRGLADEAAAAGAPADELEHYATDEVLYAQWLDAEIQLKRAYRMSAHLSPAAALLGADASAERRARVEEAFRRGESLADWDLTGADLSGIDLRGADLTRAFLERAKLDGARLDGAKLHEAVLTRADLRGANLDGADLSEANLGLASLVGASLRRAMLDDAISTGVDLSGADLSGASLKRASFEEARIDSARLCDANLRITTFREVSLNGVDLSGADLTHATFLGVDASGLDFSGARLDDATFIDCTVRGAKLVACEASRLRVVKSNFSQAHFEGAMLDGANLRDTVLRGADFSGARLNGADLSAADLSEATLYRIVARGSMWVRTNLRGASMISADLFEAVLEKADLRGTDLRGANLFAANFALVHSDADTHVEESIQDRVRFLPLRPSNEEPQSPEPTAGEP